MRVLVVDDDPANQLLTIRLLRGRGCSAVDGVSDGRQAVEAAARGYDVVLMDVIMPEVNGLEATRLIRRDHPDCVVIGVTGYDTPALRESCHDAGMAAVLAKPVPADVIFRTLGLNLTPDPDL